MFCWQTLCYSDDHSHPFAMSAQYASTGESLHGGLPQLTPYSLQPQNQQRQQQQSYQQFPIHTPAPSFFLPPHLQQSPTFGNLHPPGLVPHSLKQDSQMSITNGR